MSDLTDPVNAALAMDRSRALGNSQGPDNRPALHVKLKNTPDDVGNNGIMVSVLNSTSGALGAGASFIGVAEDVTRFPEISINLFGTPAVAPGTLYFEFSPDGVNWDVSVPYTLAGPQSFVPLALRVVLPWFRVRYVNGGTALPVFRLTTVLHWQSAKTLTRVLNQVIDNNEPVENVRAFIGGQSPDGPFTNLPATGVVGSQSTNTPLGVAGVFNAAGTILDMSGYVAASISVLADVASATNGIMFNWYADSAGTRSLGSSNFTYGTPAIRTSVNVPRHGPFLRVTYTNGGIAQTSFELVTTLYVTAPPPDVLPIASTITGNNAAQIVKANVVGLQENGVYNNVGLSNAGSIKVAVTDRPSEVRNRVHVKAFIQNAALVVAPGTTIHTVTGGKIFYLLSFIVSALNDSVSVGEFVLQDGTDTTDRIPFLLSNRSVGVPAAASAQSPSLPEPVPFTTDVRAIEIAGVINASITIVGYEE